MDDPNSRQQLDDLAELFLTSVIDAATSAPADTNKSSDKSSKDRSAEHATNDPVNASIDGPIDGLIDGPEPIRMPPKLDPHAVIEPDPDPTDQPDQDDSVAHDDAGPIPFADSHPMLRLTEDHDDPDQVALDQPTLDEPILDQPRRDQVSAAASPLIETEQPSLSAAGLSGMKPDAAEPAGFAMVGDTREAPSETPRTAPRALLEAVLLGNLPGMSGPWLTQYAQLLAQTEGPVAILHVGETAIDLEVVEPRLEAEPAPAGPITAVRIPPMRNGLTGLVGLVDALVTADRAPTQNILVRIEPDAEPRTLSQLAAIDDWTLLCGADESASAGAAHLIRSLVRADPRLADRSVGLMVMGSDQDAASDAANRIASELEYDLVQKAELIGHLKRMQPVQVREIGSFANPVELWPQLVAWFDTLQAPEPQAQPRSEEAQPVNTQDARAELETLASPADEQRDTAAPRQGPKDENRSASSAAQRRLSDTAAKLAGPMSSPKPQPAFRSTGPQAETKPDARSDAKPDAKPDTKRKSQPDTARASDSQPNPQTSPAPASHAQDRTAPRAAQAVAHPQATRRAPSPRVLKPDLELDLIGLLAQSTAALEDPLTLDARLPDQPDIQLAVDAQGIVHLLAQHRSDDQDASAALLALIEAGHWTRDHLELLALTQRDREFVDAQPMLHLMTDRPDLAAGPVARLAGQVRLHLLQQVQLGRSTGWLCTPLS